MKTVKEVVDKIKDMSKKRDKCYKEGDVSASANIACMIHGMEWVIGVDGWTTDAKIYERRKTLFGEE